MNHSNPAHPRSKSGFALISVLALVSLAALTATAFLASARLERQATRPIGETTRLQMTLNTGRECAAEVINRIGEPYWNFVTTYWRTNSADELGYLFVGKPSASNNLIWYYYCGFTPAQWTNLDSADMNTRIRATISNCQATYSNNMQTFMASATSGFSASPGLVDPKCVQIPLLGGRTSPTVGWVYIKQDIRTNPSSTNPGTSNLPVARFAYFIEDLGGLIDADRMCGTNTRNTGTNAEEISLANLAGSSASNIQIASLSSKRPQYLTPGMLLATNGGVLTSTNDLRYFASRLRYCNWTVNDNWDRIPYVPISSNLVNGSYYPSQAGQRKTNLNSNNFLNAGGATKIAQTIITNYPMFTNRAGGMNGANYINALAANIVDYADTDPSPTIFTDINGNTHVGYDNYPLPVVFCDQIAWSQNSANISNSTITVTTYIQLWNCSTLTSPAVTYTLQNNFQDRYLSSNGTVSPVRIFPNSLSNLLSVPVLGPNQIIILSVTNTTNVGTNADYPGGLMLNSGIGKCLGINNNSSTGYLTNTNLFDLRIGSTIVSQHKGSFTRIGQKITNGSWDFEGTTLTMSRDRNTPAPIGDPRMLRFLSNPPTIPLEYRSSSSGNLKWGGYANFKDHPNSTSPWNGNPDNWPDGRQGAPAPLTGTGQTGGAGGSIPVALGTPLTLPGTAPAILTTNSKFLNIFELGNIFDPMQWTPPANFSANSMYVNCDIDATWTNKDAFLYGGGSTLRIGRPEHSRFAFTNLGGDYPVPSLGTSAAGLLDLFCATNVYNWAGKININTAPPPVLAALAGGITLSKDPNKGGNEVNATMISAFTNGVIKFRSLYPFITPSQLSFISANYGTNGWTNSAVWSQNAVFGTNSLGGGLAGVTSINDEGREEWFSKIYNLTCVQSFNYRIYVVAQLTDTNGNPKGSMMRKYYQLHLRNNQPNGNGTPDTQSPSVSPVVTYEAFY